MAQLLKQSTAYTFQLGPFVDSTDGVTPEASLTIAATDVDLSKNGGAFADKTDATALTSTGDSQGYYDCVLDTTDTGTLGKLDVRCYVSGALPVFKSFLVVPAVVYDSLVAGSDLLDVSMTQILGTAVSTPATAGILDINLKNIANAAVSTTSAQLGVNVVQLSGDGTAADNAESFFDGTGYAGTNNTIPTVTAITNAVTLADGAHGGSSASLALGAGATISKADGHALTLTGGTNGHGLLASGAGTGSGIAGSGGSGGGHGLYVVGDDSGMGIYAVGGDAALTLTAGLFLTSGASANPVGLYVEDGAIITDNTGTALQISSTGGDGDGVTITGNGTGGDFVGDITGNVSGSVGSVTAGVDIASISGDTTAADRLEVVLDAMPTGVVVDDNDPDPLATAFETNLAEATNDHYNGAFIVFASGALLGQSRKISDYDGTSKVITVATAFTEAPAGDDVFLIVGRSE